MGMYTEIFINVSLRKDTPDKVVRDLRGLFDADYPAEVKSPFFRRGRMTCIGRTSSYYFQPRATSNMFFDDIAGQWYVLSRSDLKNYGSEIEQFFDWIDEYVDASPGEFIGYHRYEDDDTPVLVFKKNGGVL